jgi:trans-aconitate methyltransferase
MSQYFDEKAPDWDADDRRKQLSSTIAALILAHIPLHDRMEVPDFGTGTGLISAYAAPRVHKVDAVDNSDAMLTTLVAKPELHGKVEAVCVDISVKTLCSLVISAMVLTYVSDTTALIMNFVDHLKPGIRRETDNPLL